MASYSKNSIFTNNSAENRNRTRICLDCALDTSSIFFVALQPNSSLGLLCASDKPIAEAATDTANNEHKRPASMPSAEFEPAIPVIKRLQTYALDRTATGFVR